MELAKICLWCFNSGRTCSVCGHVAPKYKPKKKEKVYKKVENEYGCSCRKDEYCHVCRSDKIKKEGEEEYAKFLEITFIKLKKYQMPSTGHVEIDHEIL